MFSLRKRTQFIFLAMEQKQGKMGFPDGFPDVSLSKEKSMKIAGDQRDSGKKQRQDPGFHPPGEGGESVGERRIRDQSFHIVGKT